MIDLVIVSLFQSLLNETIDRKGDRLMPLNKKDVIHLLENIALYLEIKGENPFRIAAYRKAAQSIERDERSLSEIDDFASIKGIGKGTNTTIQEFIDLGYSPVLEQLQKEVPEGLLTLLDVPGLGGKRIAKLYKELSITNKEELQEACENGSVAELAGFGKKTVENILTSLNEQGSRPERIPLALMLPMAEKIENYLESIDEIALFSQAGSLRRVKETVKDIDYIIATDDRVTVAQKLVEMDHVKSIIAQGETKVSVTIEGRYDVDVDFRLVAAEEFATTLHHFTGSKEHNISMRQRAKKSGEKINEYGVEVEATNETIHFQSEEAFFDHFGLNYIPPEMREDLFNIELFEKEIPYLKRDMIQGDLHMHTTWSDGAVSVEEMVGEARRLGYAYMAITDHSKFLQVANGLNEDRLKRQREEIERLNEKYDDIHILSGVEMDILPDGTLDFLDDFLQEMDIVIAAIHSSFNQSEEDIMKRLNQALDNPYVDIIAHPTGRIIGRREGYAVEMERLIERAAETNTVLEINANPLRFDLSAKWAEHAQEKGAQLAINTDAHNIQSFGFMDIGVRYARKGRIKQDTVINTWSLDALLRYLNRNK